ncbi:MAG: hypothetical protein QFF03_23090 [Pseudomonadota bacterium]|nr:hypothetical protein [Pseudomonadota bacterium]
MKANVNAGRRKMLLAGGSALLMMVLARAQADRLSPPPPPPPALAGAGAGAALFVAAVEFIGRRYIQHGRAVVYGPVSRLQREFLLGYREGCELVAMLAAEQVWRLSDDAHGALATLDFDSPHLRRWQ